MRDPAPKYQRCLVLAGGGFRFSYYLGIYAALCDAGKKPDLLLASCGGAIAAAIIQNLPDDAQRKAWMRSPQMYAFWRLMKERDAASLSGAIAGIVRRRWFSTAKRIPNLHDDYLFEIPVNMPLPPPLDYAQRPALAIIAGKLLYTEQQAGQRTQGQPLFAETVFCEARAADLLTDMASPVSAALLPGSRVAPLIVSDTLMPLAQAVRASVSDMVYFRCHQYGDADYLGGVIDLFPIEIAHRLADQVVMEVKSAYDTLIELPAVRSVLGFDGNLRLHQVMRQHADAWVDTADMEKILPDLHITQKKQWHKNRIALVAADSYSDYQQAIEAQWQYGYQRGFQGIAAMA